MAHHCGIKRQPLRDRAVVIRTYDFGEADRVVVLLTRSHGVIRAVAKGVRRAKSRFGSRLELFVDMDIQLYAGRNLYTIAQVDTVGYYGAAIIDDYERYTAACAVLETAERLANAGGAEDSYYFDAVISTLKQLQEQDYSLVLDRFLIQAMGHAGWAPRLFDCAQCGAAGPHHAFHPGVGGAVCQLCRPSGAAEVDPETLHHLWLLAGGYPSSPSQAHLNEGHQLLKAHLQWHVEHKVCALAVMDQ